VTNEVICDEVNVTNSLRASILGQALPYIQAFMGKTVVVKYGGNAMINEALKAAVINDLVLLSCVGVRVILVHGGGPEIDGMLKRVGIERRFVNGLRYTDVETMEIVQMVLSGKVNKDIVKLIQEAGGKALGLCGIDGGLLKAEKAQKGADLGLVGEVSSVDPSPLREALEKGYIPVVATVALGTGDAAGSTLNVNADTAAAKIAAAMGAEKLVLMTDVPGILKDVQNLDSLIREVKRDELDDLVQTGIVSKGMIPKVECCRTALDGGVKHAHIIDGRVPHSLLVELLTDEGIGTMIL